MTWEEFLESRKDLALRYKQAIQDVPQDLTHHPEGNVLNHVRLVRKAIPEAIQRLKAIQNSNDPLANVIANLNFSLSDDEHQLIILAAWLHDIGKSTATTIDGKPWQTGGKGRIQAIAHQDREHYYPQLEKLRGVAPPETVDLYLQNSDLIDWLIEHHMDLSSHGGFSKKFIRDNFEPDGRIKSSPQMRLLLILLWADRLGRGLPPEQIKTSLAMAAEKVVKSSQREIDRSANIAQQSKPFEGEPASFVAMLQTRNMSQDQKAKALKGKFPHLANDEISGLLGLGEGFKQFIFTREPYHATYCHQSR